MEAPLTDIDTSHKSSVSAIANLPDPQAQELAGTSKHSVHSVKSRTSTLEFHHEPFEDFKSLVEQLCLTLWPNPARNLTLERLLGNRFADLLRRTISSLTTGHASSNTFHVERLSGGSFNRIIGITIIKPKL